MSTPSTVERADHGWAEALDPSYWVPVSQLALEGFGPGGTFDERFANLRVELADDIILDDVGRSCVARSVARDFFAKWTAIKAEERERKARVDTKRAEADAHRAEQVRADRERMKLIGRLQQQNGGGLLYENRDR